MFLQNKYTTIYYNIVDKAKSRLVEGYVEKHHVIPRSLGGCDEPSNIVTLTAREHFICHLLLVRMTTGVNKSKMVKAAYSMVGWNKLKINSKTYNFLKKLHSDEMKTNNPVFNDLVKEKISKKLQGKISPFKGKQHTLESRKKISDAIKGKVPWNKGLIGAQPSTRKGVPRSEETKLKIRESVKRTLAMKAQHASY